MEGGLDELVELRLSRACSSATIFSKSTIRFSSEAMTARIATWACGGTVFQRDSVIEGWGLIQEILRAYCTNCSAP